MIFSTFSKLFWAPLLSSSFSQTHQRSVWGYNLAPFFVLSSNFLNFFQNFFEHRFFQVRFSTHQRSAWVCNLAPSFVLSSRFPNFLKSFFKQHIRYQRQRVHNLAYNQHLSSENLKFFRFFWSTKKYGGGETEGRYESRGNVKRNQIYSIMLYIIMQKRKLFSVFFIKNATFSWFLRSIHLQIRLNGFIIAVTL